MLSFERRQAIVTFLGANGSATVRELSERHGVSQMTIRRDLEQLEKDGLISKTHGGAIMLGANTHADAPLSKRELQYSEAKQRIAQLAASLVKPGDTVILDEGSTCLAVARQLKTTSGITVITNGIRVSAELLGSTGINLIVIGGLCHHGAAMLYGPDTEKAYGSLHADYYFMGMDAFSAEYGILDGNYLQVGLKRAKAGAARRVIGVANQAKYGLRAVARIGPFSMLNALITEGPVSADLAQELAAQGIECLEA